MNDTWGSERVGLKDLSAVHIKSPQHHAAAAGRPRIQSNEPDDDGRVSSSSSSCSSRPLRARFPGW